MKTALVTGASKRIGEAMCRDLAKAGFNVAVHFSSNADGAGKLVEELASHDIKSAAFRADLTLTSGPDELFDDVLAKMGGIDLLINNASIFENDSALEFDATNMDRHHAIHVRAPAILSSRMFAQSELEAGLIINMIDQRVWRLNPNFFTYTLSKTALWTATQTMAQAFAPKVRVNAIGPGPTLANERQSAADFEKQSAAIPMRTGPRLDDFGRTAIYLYETPSITGQMIALDGGQHLAWETPDVVGINE